MTPNLKSATLKPYYLSSTGVSEQPDLITLFSGTHIEGIARSNLARTHVILIQTCRLIDLCSIDNTQSNKGIRLKNPDRRFFYEGNKVRPSNWRETLCIRFSAFPHGQTLIVNNSKSETPTFKTLLPSYQLQHRSTTRPYYLIFEVRTIEGIDRSDLARIHVISIQTCRLIDLCSIDNTQSNKGIRLKNLARPFFLRRE